MKIKNVKIKNFKGIKVIDLSTEKNMIVITGKNGAGKSSFCDAIMTALAGKDKAIVKPIRNGESKAVVEVQLDGYKVTRVFRENQAPTLHVTPEGRMEPIKSPQAWLNEHIGNLKFDPSEFAKFSEKDQREILMELSGLDLDSENTKIDNLFNERKYAKQRLKEMGQFSDAEAKLAREYKDKEIIDVVELSKEINAYEVADRQKKTNSSRITEIESEIEALKKEREELINANAQIKVLPEEELQTMRNNLDNSQEENKKIQEAKNLSVKIRDYNNQVEKVNQLEKDLESARDTKQQLIQAAQYPIEGLSVNDDGVLFNDVPFSQINDSQKIVIGTLIALALMPKDNPIKIVFIKLGSLLDDKSLSYLEKVSEEQDAQIWIEFVGEDQKGILIVEGEVVEKNGSSSEKEELSS